MTRSCSCCFPLPLLKDDKTKTKEVILILINDIGRGLLCIMSFRVNGNAVIRSNV